MTQPTADVRAVLRALLLLTTQVKRIADHTAQSSFTLAPPVVVSPDDAPTTGDDAPCNQPGPWGDAHACILPAGHPDDHQGHDGCGWRTGLCGSGNHKPHPGFSCVEVDQTRPYWNVRWEQERQAPAADEDALRTTRRDSLLVLLSRAYRGTLIPEESELLRHHVETEIRESNTARAVAAGNVRHVQQLVPEIEAQHAIIERARGMLRHLKDQGATGKTYYVALTSALNGGMQPLCHSSDPTTLRECALRIGHGADHEDGDLSWPATPDSTEIDRLTEDRDRLAAELEHTHRISAEVQRDRDQHAAVLTDVLSRFTGAPGVGHGCLTRVPEKVFQHWQAVVAPTVERPWWEQVREAQAAIERVRALADRWDSALAPARSQYSGPVRAALDYSDAEPAELVHPDTEQQVSSPEQVDDIAAVRSAVARTQERCQAVRDREGPGGMINATQVLGLLSPTWPDGNYEAPAPGTTEGP